MRKHRAIILGVFILLMAAVVVLPLIFADRSLLAMDADARKAFPNELFVKLRDGVTHYEWAGPESGKKVILIHGFTSPKYIWDYQFGALANAGFRVLRYDLFGRGHSDRPKIVYDADLFDRQLIDLLDALNVKDPVDLVGLSMGGAITINFTDRHPDRVRKIALLAPAGFPLHVPLKYRILKLPGIGDWILKAMGNQIILNGITHEITNDEEKSKIFQEKYAEQMKYWGFKEALLSTLRHNDLMSMQPVYERVGKMGKPSMLIWGTDDHVVAYPVHEQVVAALPGIEFHSIEGAGHTSNFEHPEIVNPLLISFLSK